MMLQYIQLIRVKQWVKNFFVAIPAFFAETLFEQPVLIPVLLGMLSFSLISSTVYIINDYADRENDRKHPEKCKRPLASGAISPTAAFVLMGVLLATALGLAFFINLYFLYIIGGYFVLNIAYSFFLKNIAIVDIIIIASGFLLRVFGGAFIADVVVSKWLVLMTFLLALFLGLAKRRDDLVLFNQTGKEMRSSIKHYSIEFINVSLVFMASIIVVTYIMYTVSEEVVQRIGNDLVYLTSFFVIVGLLRYLQITIVKTQSSSPTQVIYSDVLLQLIVVGWFATFGILLYAS